MKLLVGAGTMKTILLVDDDAELLSLLREYLEHEGFAVTASADAVQGFAAALAGAFDLLVLDVMMPVMSGIEVLRCLRAANSTLPVVMLTARGDDQDRIVGLELGADDYVPKPCTPRELTARIRAILRRTTMTASNAETDLLTVGHIRLSPGSRQAWLGEDLLMLTSTEFNLLEVLARHAGRTVGKDELSRRALGRPLSRFDRSIDVHVSSLRQKLGTLADGRSSIQTIYRQGYQLIR